MRDDREREERYSEAAAFLGDVLERVETGKASFEECCSEKPHLMQELKELYAACHRLQSGESKRSGGPSEAEQALSSELLAKLSERRSNFERYEIRGEIAKGGQGTVVQVWDDDLHRHLAMKVLVGKSNDPSGPRAVTPRSLSRFLEEAQVTGQLDHPGIVPIHELGLDSDGRVYFTMKLVKGRTLKEVFQLVTEGREGWTLTRALSVLLRVCEAMAYAHHKGVVHRDLKPANVMVGRFGEVYVMDWGLARVRGREDRTDVRIAPEVSTVEMQTEREQAHSRPGEHASQVVTMDGHVVGTPAYMSPEQALGRLEEVGPHSDVYSLGAMLYHLLAGHMPYVKPGTNPTNYSIWYMVQEHAPDPILERAPGVPAELVAICEKAMARDIAARYRDMGELSEDLMAFLEHRAVKAYQTGAIVELRKWVERNKGLAAASAATVLALVAGLATALVLKAESDENARLAAHNADLASANATESARNAEEARQQAAAAKASEEEARKETARAEENARIIEEKSVDLGRVSALRTLEELESEADRLWPAIPERIPDFEDWLVSAQKLVDELPVHEAMLSELEKRARPPGEDPRAQRVAALDPRAMTFDSAQDRWWHALLVKLVDDLYAFSSAETGLFTGTSPAHGWGVKKRLEFARSLEERSLSGAKASALWTEAIDSIRDPERCPIYDGLVIAPQLGLLPLGQDRYSGLWEFAHLQSGEPAVRGADGKLVLEQRTGIVLVLIPGAAMWWMGAQSAFPEGKNHDPHATADESPPNAMRLDPFFLSKYEMTQGQWLRAAGKNPSLYAPPLQLTGGGEISLLHPVEQVSWLDCQQVLARMGLELPTEAQWERGARADTSTIWWTGDDPLTLRGAENLADAFFHRGGGQNVEDWAYEDWLDDGWVVHAPIGSYTPNQFGLHDVHGNVLEWCRDWFEKYFDKYDGIKARDGDGERKAAIDSVASHEKHVIRGGDYQGLAISSRVAARYSQTPDTRQPGLGVRPARRLTR